MFEKLFRVLLELQVVKHHIFLEAYYNFVFFQFHDITDVFVEGLCGDGDKVKLGCELDHFEKCEEIEQIFTSFESRLDALYWVLFNL